EYRKRLSHWMPLELVEVEPGLRGKGRDPQRAIEDEGRRVLAALPKNAHVIALDVPGRPWSSAQLAARMEHWRQQGRDLAFLIGGPEGHAPEVKAIAAESWSLGPLNLPNMLVRLVVAEQLYRAAAMLANHPYHRACAAHPGEKAAAGMRRPLSTSLQTEIDRHQAPGLDRLPIAHGRLEAPALLHLP